MAEGRNKWFVETDETLDIFFHTSCVADYGHFGLQKLDLVSFDVKTTSRGPQAVNVKPV